MLAGVFPQPWPQYRFSWVKSLARVLAPHLASLCRDSGRSPTGPRRASTLTDPWHWGSVKAEPEGHLLWSFSAPKVKELGFGFILLKEKKELQGFDPCSTSRAKKAHTPLPQPSARGQQSRGDREEGNCNSLRTAIAQFPSRPQGSVEQRIPATWGSS